MRVVAASELEPQALRDLFNAGFSDYPVSLELGEAEFGAHLADNDVDLGCSQVVVDLRPLAFALIGRRGESSWVAGMGTVPGHRRQGLGERSLVAALAASARDGGREVWLEVIDGNEPALALYRKLGFAPQRELIVWTLPAITEPVPGHRSVDPTAAHGWIVANRAERDPWQRADPALSRIASRDPRLRGLVVQRKGRTVAAAVFRDEGASATAFQLASVDDAGARQALLAAAAQRDLRLSNAPADGPASRVLEDLGATAAVRQHEMRLAV